LAGQPPAFKSMLAIVRYFDHPDYPITSLQMGKTAGAIPWFQAVTLVTCPQPCGRGAGGFSFDAPGHKPPLLPEALIGDKAYDADPLIDMLNRREIMPAIPQSPCAMICGR
jgi:hypothetical protein